MFIRSERLFLRPGWPEDGKEFLRRVGAWIALRQFAWPAPATRAGPPAHDAQIGRFPRLVVTLPGGEGARLIGCVGLSCSAYGAELAFWITPELRGQGYASEAARAMLGLACMLGHRHIAAIHFADNSASTRVLKKLGFNPTGETCYRLCTVRGAQAPAVVHRLELAADRNGPAIGSTGERARYAA